MNAKMKSIALMAAMMAMSQPMPLIECERVIKKDTSYLNKKCKSCKLFPCNDNRHKWRSKPLAQACKIYEHK